MQQSSGGGLMGVMAQGMAFGAGSEVAHQAVRSFMGGPSAHPQEAQAPMPAAVESKLRDQDVFLEKIKLL